MLVVLLWTSGASALNEVYENSCLAPCTKLPKFAIFARQYGDLGASGEMGTLTATLAQGKKKTIVRVDFTFEWFTLSAQFRPFQLRLNGKFPSPSLGIVLNHLDSCGNGECMRSASVWFNVDELESLYPGQFHGQPLVVTLNSAKAADAGSNYVASMSVQVVKNK